MTWSVDHDVLLCREILVEEPFRFKAGTKERGQVWDKVANSLNSCKELRFLVKQRGVKRKICPTGKNFKCLLP